MKIHGTSGLHLNAGGASSIELGVIEEDWGKVEALRKGGDETYRGAGVTDKWF